MSGVSATSDIMFAAGIGAGGSVVGGIVGGWFAIRATHRQWQRDRDDARIDRSRLAAMAIADSISEMDFAVFNWDQGRTQADDLRASFNALVRTLAVQSLLLTDDELRARVAFYESFASMVQRMSMAGD